MMAVTRDVVEDILHRLRGVRLSQTQADELFACIQSRNVDREEFPGPDLQALIAKQDKDIAALMRRLEARK